MACIQATIIRNIGQTISAQPRIKTFTTNRNIGRWDTYRFDLILHGYLDHTFAVNGRSILIYHSIAIQINLINAKYYSLGSTHFKAIKFDRILLRGSPCNFATIQLQDFGTERFHPAYCKFQGVALIKRAIIKGIGLDPSNSSALATVSIAITIQRIIESNGCNRILITGR